MSELYRTSSETGEPAENKPAHRVGSEPGRDVTARQRQDNAAIEARLDEAGLPTRAESRAAAMAPGAEDDEDDFGPDFDAAAIEARLPEAGLPTRAEARAAAMAPGADEDDPDSGYDDDAEPVPAPDTSTPAPQDAAPATRPAEATPEQTPSPKQQRISALEAGLSDAGRKIANLETKNDALETENVNLKQTVAGSEKKIADLAQTVADSSQMIADRDQKIVGLEQRAANADQRVTAADQKIAIMQAEKDELVGRVDRIEQLLTRAGRPPDAVASARGGDRPGASPDQQKTQGTADNKHRAEMAAREDTSKGGDTKDVQNAHWRRVASAGNFGMVSAALSVADTMHQFSAHADPWGTIGVGAVATGLISVTLDRIDKRRKEPGKT